MDLTGHKSYVRGLGALGEELGGHLRGAPPGLTDLPRGGQAGLRAEERLRGEGRQLHAIVKEDKTFRPSSTRRAEVSEVQAFRDYCWPDAPVYLDEPRAFYDALRRRQGEQEYVAFLAKIANPWSRLSKNEACKDDKGMRSRAIRTARAWSTAASSYRRAASPRPRRGRDRRPPADRKLESSASRPPCASMTAPGGSNSRRSSASMPSASVNVTVAVTPVAVEGRVALRVHGRPARSLCTRRERTPGARPRAPSSSLLCDGRRRLGLYVNVAGKAATPHPPVTAATRAEDPG